MKRTSKIINNQNYRKTNINLETSAAIIADRDNADTMHDKLGALPCLQPHQIRDRNHKGRFAPRPRRPDNDSVSVTLVELMQRVAA